MTYLPPQYFLYHLISITIICLLFRDCIDSLAHTFVYQMISLWCYLHFFSSSFSFVIGGNCCSSYDNRMNDSHLYFLCNLISYRKQIFLTFFVCALLHLTPISTCSISSTFSRISSIILGLTIQKLNVSITGYIKNLAT